MGPIEEIRRELQNLDTMLSKHRKEMSEEIARVSCLLMGKADQILLPMADEIGSKEVTHRKTITPETGIVGTVPALPPGKRGCGICGKPGHRRTTCPDADKDFKAQRAKKERKALSPERKAQLKVQLEKARAARKGKK
jgi:hypothetical protein